MSLPLLALAIVTVTSITIFVLGRRFNRGYIKRTGELPRSFWMLQRSDDADLENTRRFALGLLPVYLIALAIYLLRP